MTLAASDLAPWFRKLQNGAPLGDVERAALAAVVRDLRVVAGDVDIKRHGDGSGVSDIVLDGLACRYKLLADGRRQIVAFLVPGDSCDLALSLLGPLDHAIGSLAPTRVASVASEELLGLIDRYPRLARAFWGTTLRDEAILREWLVNVGRRDALERMAHLLWELFLRHDAVGLISGATFSLPLTQQELADALGLSAVHVNRTLGRLRSEGLVEFGQRRLTILQPTELQRISGFNADYLHLGEAGSTPQVRRRAG